MVSRLGWRGDCDSSQPGRELNMLGNPLVDGFQANSQARSQLINATFVTEFVCYFLPQSLCTGDRGCIDLSHFMDASDTCVCVKLPLAMREGAGPICLLQVV